MNYPLCGVPADVAFVLSYDIEWPLDKAPRMAEKHLQSGLAQFSDSWLPGVAAVISAKIAKQLVIVGGYEARYPNRRVARPEAIKFLLEKDFGVTGIECLISDPNTMGNARAISEWLHKNSLFVDMAIVVCAYWHGMRAAADLGCQGVRLPVIPAEAAYIATQSTPHDRAKARKALELSLGGGLLAERIAGECNGMAEKMLNVFVPLSEQAKEKTAA